MIIAVYCYLAIAFYYSFYFANKFKDIDVPFWRVIIYSLVSPYFLITYYFCYCLSFLGIHISIIHAIETNTPDEFEGE